VRRITRQLDESVRRLIRRVASDCNTCSAVFAAGCLLAQVTTLQGSRIDRDTQGDALSNIYMVDTSGQRRLRHQAGLQFRTMSVTVLHLRRPRRLRAFFRHG
jgi:hypothetical protein